MKNNVKFCWHCNRQLQGNHRTEKMIEGELRTLHKQCAKLYGPKLTVLPQGLVEEMWLSGERTINDITYVKSEAKEG